MESILVTGGTGFIGSHTSLLLLEKGHTLFILDSCINSSKKSIDHISMFFKGQGIELKGKLNFIKGDIKNKADIEKVFQKSLKIKKPIEAVIHFAGLKSVFDSIVDPLNYWNNNVFGTICLLEIMEKFGCKNIVFSSSATVYKNLQSDRLLNEDDLCEPINPYGNTKLAIERILKDVFKKEPSQWRIACLRYFNPVGAHESGCIGEDPLGKPNNIYPQITKVAKGILKEIKIFGSDWPTQDGTGIRDYIHVMDLAEGHLLALNHLMKNSPQILTINLGTGKGTSVLELINIFQKVNNVVVPFSFADRRPGDNAIVVADNTLAKNILNWLPRRNIEEICRDGWNWQLKNPDGYR
tara:strand:- start:3504 stop:4562 length:1059 start_codon:yes stop_codon:yes gene_type:complete